MPHFLRLIPTVSVEFIFREVIRKNKRIVTSIALFSLVIITVAGCATTETVRHKYIMRGQVLEVTGDEAYICIGNAEGGKAGQEYTVYRFVKSKAFSWKQASAFKRELVGEVKITDVVHEHYAKIRELKGDVRVNDMVQLKE
jgi:hypothetical protein